jgi:hypothetical protein
LSAPMERPSIHGTERAPRIQSHADILTTHIIIFLI